MRIITAPESYIRQPNDITVFLAGGITNCWEWQNKVIEMLQNEKEVSLDNLVIFNPRRKDFPINDPNASEEQIKWEFNMLEQCDIFSMYFCAGESDQPICMYELGRNICRMQMRFPTTFMNRIVISVEDGYKRAKDVAIQGRLAFGYPLEDYWFDSYTDNIEDHSNYISYVYVYLHNEQKIFTKRWK